MKLIAGRGRPVAAAGAGLLGRTFLLSALGHVAVLGTLAATRIPGGSGPPPRPVTLRTEFEPAPEPEEALPVMEAEPPAEEPTPVPTEILLDEFPVEPDERLLPQDPGGTGEFPVIGLPGPGDRFRPRSGSGRAGSGDESGDGTGGGDPAPSAGHGVPPAPEPAPVVYRVARPDADRCASPVYPARSRERGVEGSVRLRVNVAADGSVGEVEIALSSGSEELDRAALEAVRGWTFLPATEDGNPVPSVVLQPVSFRLR